MLFFYISILSQYGIEEVFERIENSLELLVDMDNDLSLGASILIFIFIFEKIHSKMLVNRDLVAVESVIFTNSLVGTTMQDGSKKERSIEILLLLSFYFRFFTFLLFLIFIILSLFCFFCSFSSCFFSSFLFSFFFLLLLL